MGLRSNRPRSRGMKNASRKSEPLATSLLVDIPPYDYLDEPQRRARPKPSLPTLKFLENQGGSNG